MAANLELTVSQLNEYVRRMFQMDPMLRAIEPEGRDQQSEISSVWRAFLHDEG